jgi:hypothetical protein
MVQMAEQAAEMENVYDENFGGFRSFEDVEVIESKSNDFVKGLVIGAGAGAAVTGGIFGGLWIKEKREAKKYFELLAKVNAIATHMDQNPTDTKMKWNKEEIDLANKTMKNPLDLQIELKRMIDETKLVTKKTKKKWNDELEKFSNLSAALKGKELNAEAEAVINATETVEEKK